MLMILSEGEKRSCEQWVTSHAPVIFCDSADTPTYFRDCLVLRYSIYIYIWGGSGLKYLEMENFLDLVRVTH